LPAVKQREVARSAAGLPLQTSIGNSERAHTNRTSLQTHRQALSLIDCNTSLPHAHMASKLGRFSGCEKNNCRSHASHDRQKPLNTWITQPLAADITRHFLLRCLTAQYYSAPRCIAGIADTYQPSSSISPPNTDIVSANRLMEQNRGPRVQPPTNNGRTLARHCGAKDCPPQGADRAARVAPPTRASIRLQRAERGVSIGDGGGSPGDCGSTRRLCVM